MTDNAIRRPGTRFVHELQPCGEVQFLADGRIVVANPDKPPLVIDGERAREVTP